MVQQVKRYGISKQVAKYGLLHFMDGMKFYIPVQMIINLNLVIVEMDERMSDVSLDYLDVTEASDIPSQKRAKRAIVFPKHWSKLIQ